eukprot:s307_g15.t2
MALDVAEKNGESLSGSEVQEILKRADLEEDAESFKGQGGMCVVIAVAVFSSLAGLLMGLDIGYIAGVKTMKSFSQDLLQHEALMELEDSVITMIFGLGAALAAFPPVMQACVNCLGRKGTVVAGGWIFCLGSALQCVAINLAMMLLGRLIAGMSVGLLSGNAPVYTSEIAPPAVRGALVTGFQFAVTVGIMLAFLLALVLEDVEEPVSGWRWVIAAQMVPGSLLLILGAFMPGSPRHLVAQGKMKEALQTLRKLRKEDVSLELAQIYLEYEAEASTEASWHEFLTGDNGQLLRIGVTIQLLAQMCGMNAFMYHGPVIFKLIFQSDHAGLLFTVVSGVVNILATIPAILVVDRCGRTFLMKWSALGMMTCSAVLAAVGDICLEGENLTCGDWAKVICTVAICGFILNFAYGWGGMAWLYCSEMFPQKYRTKGVGATTDAAWVGNILIAFMPPLMFANWGFDTFWVFVGTNTLCLWLALILPETKDKSLEEIRDMFSTWLKVGAESSEPCRPCRPCLKVRWGPRSAILSASQDMLRIHPCDAISNTSDAMDVEWKGLQDMRICYPEEKLLAVSAEGSQLGIWVADLQRREAKVSRARGNSGSAARPAMERASPNPIPLDAEADRTLPPPGHGEMAEVKVAQQAAGNSAPERRAEGELPEPPRRPVRSDRPVSPRAVSPQAKMPSNSYNGTTHPPLPAPWNPVRHSNSAPAAPPVAPASGPNTPTATKPPAAMLPPAAPAVPAAPAAPAVPAIPRPTSGSLGAAAPSTPTAATRLAPAPFADPNVVRSDLDTIAAQHPQMMGVLRRRFEQTQRLKELWAQGNLAGISGLLAMPQDQAVLCDLARSLMLKDLASDLNLDACSAFLPLLKELLVTSKYEDFVATALEFTELLLMEFGSLISETREICSKIPERQLDPAREQRFNKCNTCFQNFKEIHQLILAGQGQSYRNCGKLTSNLKAFLQRSERLAA